MTELLFDASSLVDLIRSSDEESKSEAINRGTILDLTYYELGNVVWKQAGLTKVLSEKETETLTEALATMLGFVKRIEPSQADFSKILDTARGERLTFYDASYIHFAKKNELTLVTNDGRLSKIAKKYAKVASATDVVKARHAKMPG